MGTKGVFVTPSESTPAENDPQNRCLVVPADKPIASEPSANARVDSLMKESTTKPSPEFRIPTLGHEYYTVVDRRLASQDVVFTTLPAGIVACFLVLFLYILFRARKTNNLGSRVPIRRDYDHRLSDAMLGHTCP